MAKTTSVVASYSGLYEEGDVEHINCPHPPSHYRGGANQRPKEVAHVVAYIGTGESGRMGGPKVMNLIIELQISC